MPEDKGAILSFSCMLHLVHHLKFSNSQRHALLQAVPETCTKADNHPRAARLHNFNVPDAMRSNEQEFPISFGHPDERVTLFNACLFCLMVPVPNGMQGNSEVLDHVLVRSETAQRTLYEEVHINAFLPHAQQASDHDPPIAKITLGSQVQAIPGACELT